MLLEESPSKEDWTDIAEELQEKDAALKDAELDLSEKSKEEKKDSSEE